MPINYQTPTGIEPTVVDDDDDDEVIWENALSSHGGFGLEPQTKSNLLHHTVKIRDLVVMIFTILLSQ